MSLLRLAQGDAAGAYTSIKRALVAAETHAFTQARLLPAAIEIGLAAGDLDTVAKQVAELGQIADSFRTTALTATADYARGQPLLPRCDNSLRDCATPRNCGRSCAPYEVARARTALGEAYRREGDEEGSPPELTPPAAFERLGALPDARRVGSLLGEDTGTAARAGERVRRTFVFTDIVGSTPLVEALGDDAWQELIRWHDQTFRAIFDRDAGWRYGRPVTGSSSPSTIPRRRSKRR